VLLVLSGLSPRKSCPEKLLFFSAISEVKLLITYDAFCIVQRATAQSKIGIFSRL
jgi:hypothetical protein